MHKATPKPLTKHDARVKALSRILQRAFVRLQEEAELEMLDGLLEYSNCSNSVRDHIVDVAELSQRQSGQKRCRLLTGGPCGDCKVRLANSTEEENWYHRKTPPPMYSQEKRTRRTQRRQFEDKERKRRTDARTQASVNEERRRNVAGTTSNSTRGKLLRQFQVGNASCASTCSRNGNLRRR